MEDKFAPTPGELFAADFGRLGDLLAGPEFSLSFAQQLAKDFPELGAAFSKKVANAVSAQPPDITLLRLAEELGVLNRRAAHLFRATEEGKFATARWLAAGLDPGAVLEEISQAPRNLQGLVVIFQNVVLPKEVKLALLNIAFQLIADIFFQLDILHYNIHSFEDIDARAYPLVRTYLEFTEHRLRPGKQVADPEFLARSERELKAAAWIVDTFDRAYPGAGIYEEFNFPQHPNDSEVVRRLVEAYRKSRSSGSSRGNGPTARESPSRRSAPAPSLNRH